MKFSPSAKFLRFASSNFKLIGTAAYFRKTTSLGLSLEEGEWIDASSKIVDIPDANTQIEYGIGQFTADSIDLVGKDIGWWDDKIFNAAAREYVECKIVVRIGDGCENIADDVVYYFTGFVDLSTVVPIELDDSYNFTVVTADGNAVNLNGELLTTKYYSSEKGGIVLFGISGVYVSSTNTGINPVKAGVHKISYDYNSGSPQLRIDNGMWVSITHDGTFIIGNGNDYITETQQLSVVIKYWELPRVVEEQSDKIILLSSPSPLPSTWYYGVSLRHLLHVMYGAIGVSVDTINLSQVGTYDGSRRLSMLEYIADGSTDPGVSYAIAGSATTILYLSNRHNVFQFDTSSGVFSLVCSVTTNHSVSKLIYNARNNHLWILHGTTLATNYGGYLSRYDVSTRRLHDDLAVTNAHCGNIELFDFDYINGFEYSLLYPVSNTGSIMRVDGNRIILSTLFGRADMGYESSYGADGWRYAYQWKKTENIYCYRFQTSEADGVGRYDIKFDSDIGVAWQMVGNPWSHDYAHLIFSHSFGAYDSVNDIVYGYDTSDCQLKGYRGSDGDTQFEVATLAEGDSMGGMYHDGSNLYYTTAMERKVRRFYVTELSSGIEIYNNNIFTQYSSYVTIGGVTYGVDIVGRVFQISSTIELYIEKCDFEGKSIKDNLTDTLRACNCIGSVSMRKAATVYMRGDANGLPVTSGHVINLNVGNVENIQKDIQFGESFDMVEIDNGTVSTSYNGIAFDTMSDSFAKRILRIENQMIPSACVSDYIVMFYNYFNTKRYIFTFSVLPSLFHIELMDGANLSFLSTRIQASATNCPIYTASYSADSGKMEIGVLV